MTFIAFGLIFLSVFLHVTWNFLSKITSPSLGFYSIMSMTASLIWLPFLLKSQLIINLLKMPCYFWLLLFTSIFAEVIYASGLAFAYKKNDISLVYPVVRAMPVLMISIITQIFSIGKPLNFLVIICVVLISSGCIIMTIKSGEKINILKIFKGGLVFIILGAIGTTIYTIVDSQLIVLIKNTGMTGYYNNILGLLCLIECGLALGLLVLSLSIKSERKIFQSIFLKKIHPIFSGICSSSAYALILFAMQFVTNVSYLQAFRQMSLPLGFLAGIILLHEKANRFKIFGMIIIVVGLIIIAFN